MAKTLSDIYELKTIREQISKLAEKETELSSPTLCDQALIKEVYGWFCEVYPVECCSSVIEIAERRTKFLFIAMFLFAPSSLFGGRLPNGCRFLLSSLFPDISPCTISNSIDKASFYYLNYKDFRHDVERIYTYIEARLREKGLINL